jgi:hypothetical protein
MIYYLTKIITSAVLISLISETAKRNSLFAALMASLPIVSILAFIWLYLETGSTEKISTLSYGIFWLVIPSLVLFIVFPLLLKAQVNFWLSLTCASLATAACYFAMVRILAAFGIQIQ